MNEKNNIDLANILENTPGLIYWKDVNGYFLGCNKQFLKDFHVKSRDDVIGKTNFDFCDRSDAVQYTENDKKVISNKQTYFFEEAITLPSGDKITYLSRKSPLLDQAGNIIGVIGNSINIEEQKKHEAELVESNIESLEAKGNAEAYLKSVIANLPGHIFWQDDKGVFLGCNDLHAINAGLERAEDLVGKSVDELADMMGWKKDMPADFRNNDFEVIKDGRSISVEEDVVWADGIPRTFLSKKSPLKDLNGKIVGTSGIALDITEQKILEKKLRRAKEQAEAANIAKSNFIANISHDLRTPLHSMIGIAELLQIQNHYPQQEELIEGIIQSGQNLLKLVEQILDFSELEADERTSEAENFNLRQLIENVILDLLPKAKQKNIELIISYDSHTPSLVYSNSQQVRRILLNLIGNSIKFTDHGHVLVAVEPVEQQGDQITLQIIVEDTGVGISKENVKHIFERFYRADPSYTGKYKGSGLGLAITKQLTENLGGDLSVNSQLGFGTTFRCSLPFQLGMDSIDTRKMEDKFSQANILIIDDHVTRRDTLLKQFPCKNKTALSSDAALAQLENTNNSNHYNFFIIDDEINAISPDNLIELIEKNNTTKHEPFLVLSTNLNDNLKVVSPEQEQYHQMLSKPIQPSEIYHRLVPCWRKWQETQQRKNHQKLNRTLNVLLVEDELLIQKFTQATLSEFGCQVALASNGQEALDKALNTFDLIFMDVGLPDMSGLDVTRKIRAERPANKNTQIIALTAHVSEDDKQRCLDAGFDSFLTKPTSYSDFHRILSDFDQG